MDSFPVKKCALVSGVFIYQTNTSRDMHRQHFPIPSTFISRETAILFFFGWIEISRYMKQSPPHLFTCLMHVNRQMNKQPKILNSWGERGTWPPLVEVFETHYSLFHIGACTCGSDRWQNTFDWTHMATHIHPTKICRNIRTFAQRNSWSQSKVSENRCKNSQATRTILRKKYPHSSYQNSGLQTTSEIQVQCEKTSEKKISEQLSKRYIWEFLVKVINVLNAFPVRFYHLISLWPGYDPFEAVQTIMRAASQISLQPSLKKFVLQCNICTWISAGY